MSEAAIRKESALDVAERFFSGIEAGNADQVRACYAPHARIWHNTDGIEQTREQNLAVLTWLFGAVPERHYEVIQRVEVPGGFLQQHVMHGKMQNGKTFAMPACIICRVEDGAITRLDEYLDGKDGEALADAMPKPHETIKTSADVPRAKNVDEAKAQLDEFGISVMEGVLNEDELARVREAVRRGVERDEKHGVQLHGFPFDPDTLNTRIFDLVNKDAVFRELVEHPLALQLVPHVIGSNFLLSNFSGNITAPGSGPMGLHADQGYVPAPWPPYPLAVNIAWAIDDFTVECGATRFVPASHGGMEGPEPGRTDYETVPIECPAGSIFIMDGRVWHETGPNVSKDTTRIGLFAYYVRPFLRPQWNWSLTVPEDVLKEASPLLQAMLGFGDNPTGSLNSLYLKKKTS